VEAEWRRVAARRVWPYGPMAPWPYGPVALWLLMGPKAGAGPWHFGGISARPTLIARSADSATTRPDELPIDQMGELFRETPWQVSTSGEGVSRPG
jgi:hypothetical protein